PGRPVADGHPVLLRGRGLRGALRQLPGQHALRVFLRRGAPAAVADRRGRPRRAPPVPRPAAFRGARLRRVPAPVRRPAAAAGAAPAGVPAAPRAVSQFASLAHVGSGRRAGGEPMKLTPKEVAFLTALDPYFATFWEG